MERAKDKNVERDVSTEKKLDDLYKLIDGIEICLMTTRRPDGHLVTRPMGVQERSNRADLWFVTNVESHKLDELARDPHVNLGFYKHDDQDWVSVSGIAKLSQDRALIHELYTPNLKAWFPEDGGARDGGPDDPRIALVLVEAHSVHYAKRDRPKPAVLFEIAKGVVTGEAPKTADVRELGARELRGGAPSA